MSKHNIMIYFSIVPNTFYTLYPFRKQFNDIIPKFVHGNIIVLYYIVL